jgi:twinkle protein
LSFLEARGIPASITQSEGIAGVSAYIPQLEDTVPCIAFPYVKNGQVVNVKYRALQDKAFRQESGAEKVLYRQDCIKKEAVCICEGEIDALSVVVAGVDSVVSVPDGAPAVATKNYAAKFTYLDQEPDPFEGVEKIVLAVDADEPGQVLQRELARRLGTDRCWFVEWPADCKDANEVLLQYGAEFLRLTIEQARPFPVQDVVEPLVLTERIMERYYHAPARGHSTGWDVVDEYYTVEPGQLTIVTGVPSSGKSEWLDALVLNLAQAHDWVFAVCSPENAPVELHIEKLLEKVEGKPIRLGPSDRMSPHDIASGLMFLQAHLRLIVPEDALTIQGVIDRATVLVRRVGIHGLVIDPFNEFDHTRERGQTETEYIGHVLGALKRWARKWGVHVWLVAHPQKLFRREDGSYPIPTPYDINGSANFRNKADNCITVWRDEAVPDSPVQIHIQKVRHKHIGRVGMAELEWDRRTGRYASVLTID